MPRLSTRDQKNVQQVAEHNDRKVLTIARSWEEVSRKASGGWGWWERERMWCKKRRRREERGVRKGGGGGQRAEREGAAGREEDRLFAHLSGLVRSSSGVERWPVHPE